MPHNGKENCLHYPQNSPVHPISQWNNGIEEEEKILKVLKVKRKNYEFSFKVWSLYCISLILTIPVFEFEIRFSDARFLSQEISRIYGIFDIRSITTTDLQSLLIKNITYKDWLDTNLIGWPASWWKSEDQISGQISGRIPDTEFDIRPITGYQKGRISGQSRISILWWTHGSVRTWRRDCANDLINCLTTLDLLFINRLQQ